MGANRPSETDRTAITAGARRPHDATIAVAMRRAALAVLSRSMVLLALIAAVTFRSRKGSNSMGAPLRRPLALPGETSDRFPAVSFS